MLFNKRLWAIYQMANHHDSIRALLLYDFEIDSNESGYKFILICTNPSTFFIDLNWVKEIEPVSHIEKERSFYHQQDHIYFNCCVIFKSGWSSQFIFIKNNQPNYFLKQRKVIVFMDRDFLIKSEQIRIEAVNLGQWQDPPTENELRVLACEFYEGILQLCRLIKQQQLYLTLEIKEKCIEQTIIHLIQWLTYFGECFCEDELKEIRMLTNYPTQIIESITFRQLSKYIQLANNLFRLYCKHMKYNYQTQQVLLLKEYIEILLRQEQITSKGYKMDLVRVD